MNNPKQLELALEMALEDAAEMPVLADLHALWQQAEPIMAQLSIQERLRWGATVIEQLADLHRAKAERLLEDWENTYNPQDPELPGDWLQGMVRQSQQVDLSRLTAPVQRRPKGKSSKRVSDNETIVGEVTKANLLKMLDQVEQEVQKETVLAVAHEENIQESVATIMQWFKQDPQPILLSQLQEQLGWPLVQLWLSLLLGGFRLEVADNQFYSARIWVTAGEPFTENPTENTIENPTI
ncbi:MAG: hypothetical protein F6K42_12325 [Leptolyngbya sp. SIO1D8]|nr:hypothetical protein [Leptolyngbya sp. SIO1D8]